MKNSTIITIVNIFLIIILIPLLLADLYHFEIITPVETH